MKSTPRFRPFEIALFGLPLTVFLLSAWATTVSLTSPEPEPEDETESSQAAELAEPTPLPLSPITATAFSRDGTLLLIGNEAGAAYCYRTGDGSPLRELSHQGGSISDLAFSPDGQLVAGIFKDILQVWDWPSGHLKRQLKGKVSSSEFAFTPDSRTIAFGVKGEGIRLWNVRTGSFQTLRASLNWAVSIAISHDGKSLAACCSPLRKPGAKFGKPSVVDCWDLSTRRRLWEKNDEDVNGTVEFSPADDRVAVACNNPAWVNARTGKLEFKMNGDNDTYDGTFHLTPDGSVVAATSSEQPFFFCDTQSGKAGHFVNDEDPGALGRSASTFCFSPNQKWFAQGDDQGVIQVWDVSGLDWKKAVAQGLSPQPPRVKMFTLPHAP